jgi:hypothetical protein
MARTFHTLSVMMLVQPGGRTSVRRGQKPQEVSRRAYKPCGGGGKLRRSWSRSRPEGIAEGTTKGIARWVPPKGITVATRKSLLEKALKVGATRHR